ncbi:MAG: L-rhamnose mutarotase [Bacteroidota bacterium]
MTKIAFSMQLKAGCEQEYQRRHDTIWPELALLLKEAGISDYSIFLDESSGRLFGVQLQSDPAMANRLPQAAVMQKWWSYMADLMDTNPDDSPVVQPLRMVFHME